MPPREHKEREQDRPADSHRLPPPVRSEDRDQEGYDREMAGRGAGPRSREAYERERERDAELPITERRREFLTEDERTEQAEEAHRQYPGGYSPTARLGD